MSKYELYHHGILGQKWGVRRFQNEDGTLTDAGRKRLANRVVKSERKQINSAQPYSRSKEFKDTVRKSIESSNIITKEDSKKLKSLYDKQNAAWSKYFDEDYLDSDQAVKDTAKAYNDTINYFKKNDKRYLDEIVKRNGGDMHNLDMFHDFRKVFDGMCDIALSKGQGEWDKTHDTKQLEREANAASKEYADLCRSIGDRLFKEYGNITVVEATKYSSARTLSDEVAAVVSSMVYSYDAHGNVIPTGSTNHEQDPNKLKKGNI